MASRVFPHLFSEGKIGNMTFRNRTVMPAMETNYAEKAGEVNDRVINYYARRSQGGVGLIIVEGACIAQEGKGFPNEIGIDDDKHISGLKRLARAVQNHGARAAIQLLHAGRQTRSEVTGGPLVAPSAIPCPSMREVPIALTKEQILKIEYRYAQAARRAKKAGFDAIEVHGAHGYLIHQFLSPLANQREDKYGGSKKNRLRFAREVLEKIRVAVGKDFPVILRMSAKEFMEGGIDLALSTEYCKALSPLVDALHISGGAYGAEEWICQPYSNEPGLYGPLAGHIKGKVDLPVITVGRMQFPELANRIIADGNADFIAMGRALIADPDLPAKAESGAVDDIWPCLSCNIGCMDRVGDKLPLGCVVNPRVGKEGLSLDKIQAGTTCLVCGGGPAGLCAAVTLAERGARVVLAEGNTLGGQLMLAAKAPYKEHFAGLIQRYLRRLDQLGVEIVDTDADLPLVGKIDPDLVVVATGSGPVIPPIPGLDTIHHMTYDKALAEDITETVIAIIGGGATGCELAERLLEKGKTVSVVEMQKYLIPELGSMRKPLYRRLKKMGLSIHNLTRIVEVRNGDVVLEKEGEELVLSGVQCLIFACGVRPDNRLEKELSKVGVNFVSIGDCRKPQNAFWAVRDGFETALSAFN